MRCLVLSGIERAAAELLSAAETVPGVRFKWLAMVFSVTFRSACRLLVLVGNAVTHLVAQNQRRKDTLPQILPFAT
jgi:hypothetical protein